MDHGDGGPDPEPEPLTLKSWLWDLRGQVSLLLSEGHRHAWSYPVGMIWDEVSLVVDRKNRDHATTAILLNLAVSAVLSEKAGKNFSKQIEKLR